MFQPMMNNLVVVFYMSVRGAAAHVKLSMFAISFSVLGGRLIINANHLRDTQTEYAGDIRAWTQPYPATGIIIVAIFGEGLFEVFLGSDYERNQFLLYFLCCNLINGLWIGNNAHLSRRKDSGLVNLITSMVFVIGFIIVDVWSDTEIGAILAASLVIERYNRLC